MWATIGILYLANKSLEFFIGQGKNQAKEWQCQLREVCEAAAAFSYINQQLKMLLSFIVCVFRYPTKPLTNLTASEID